MTHILKDMSDIPRTGALSDNAKNAKANTALGP